MWAAHYEQETVVSHLENETVAALHVATAACALLDVGCGTARRLRETNAAIAIGVDLSLDMLAAAKDARTLVVADVCALPLAECAFDIVWCRLMIGHVYDVVAAYAELSRVCVPGGRVIVTDIAPEAIAAGHRRTFVDADGVPRELEHFVHDDLAHQRAARAVGLHVERHVMGHVGPTVRHYYEEAGRLSAYTAQFGSPLVAARLLRKSEGSER